MSRVSVYFIVTSIVFLIYLHSFIYIITSCKYINVLIYIISEHYENLY